MLGIGNTDQKRKAGSNGNKVTRQGNKESNIAKGFLEKLKIQTGIEGTQKRNKAGEEKVRRNQDEIQVGDCLCCGTIVSYPNNARKFRCTICKTTNIISYEEYKEEHQGEADIVSLSYLKSIIDKSIQETRQASEAGIDRSTHEAFDALSRNLYRSFLHSEIINRSFRVKKMRRLHYSKSGLNLGEIRAFFDLLTTLPTKRPLFSALSGAAESLKRIDTRVENDPSKVYWLLILLEIPFLSKCLLPLKAVPPEKLMIANQEIRSLCYEILRKVIGVLLHTSSFCSNYFASWYSKLSYNEFSSKVDLINLFITFHLKNYYWMANKNQERSSTHYNRRGKSAQNHLNDIPTKDDGAEETGGSNPRPSSFSINQFSGIPARSKSKKDSNSDNKVRIYQYSEDWRLKTASIFLSILLKSNLVRNGIEKLPVSNFYNSLVDFVQIKLDFDSWQNLQHPSKKENLLLPHPEIQTVLNYIHGNDYSALNKSSFFFCGFPFLISLGAKISILEYEARRQMERKAEEAFINSLDKRIAIDTYFKVRVRREFIVQDSLRCIKLNSTNLKKSLRVQFVNEPGIDAGGLKKEWFLLLSKALFSPEAGMFVNLEDSNYLWFSLTPIENKEMYYLFGAVLGLAIYNSTILNLKFPIALYKILLCKSLSFKDYEQLYPILARNLTKLREYQEDEFQLLDMTFEISYKDVFGKIRHVELVPNGSNMSVTLQNVDLYIEKYYKFFIFDGIADQVSSFKNGFSNVMAGNAFSLFLPEEIELLLCGNDEEKLDLDILKSITKYVGWKDKSEAVNSPTIRWFWEFMESRTYKQQKKFLSFVTGSDRVPATGIQHLNFKISKQASLKGSERLPVAHTCFNELGLYLYTSKEQLFSKLNMAIFESSGFGIK